MNDPVIFLNFLHNILQVRPARVREEIVTFVETFEDLLSSSDVVSRQNSLAGISLNYLLRKEELGSYKANWPTREKRLNQCIVLRSSRYKSDTKSLYSLLVEHIVTLGCNSNFVIKHKRFKDGRHCYHKLKSHFHNKA